MKKLIAMAIVAATLAALLLPAVVGGYDEVTESSVRDEYHWIDEDEGLGGTRLYTSVTVRANSDGVRSVHSCAAILPGDYFWYANAWVDMWIFWTYGNRQTGGYLDQIITTAFSEEMHWEDDLFQYDVYTSLTKNLEVLFWRIHEVQTHYPDCYGWNLLEGEEGVGYAEVTDGTPTVYIESTDSPAIEQAWEEWGEAIWGLFPPA